MKIPGKIENVYFIPQQSAIDPNKRITFVRKEHFWVKYNSQIGEGIDINYQVLYEVFTRM